MRYPRRLQLITLMGLEWSLWTLWIEARWFGSQPMPVAYVYPVNLLLNPESYWLAYHTWPNLFFYLTNLMNFPSWMTSQIVGTLQGIVMLISNGGTTSGYRLSANMGIVVRSTNSRGYQERDQVTHNSRLWDPIPYPRPWSKMVKRWYHKNNGITTPGLGYERSFP